MWQNVLHAAVGSPISKTFAGGRSVHARRNLRTLGSQFLLKPWQASLHDDLEHCGELSMAVHRKAMNTRKSPLQHLQGRAKGPI